MAEDSEEEADETPVEGDGEDPDGSAGDRLVREVAPFEAGGHVVLPAEWVGETVEVVKGTPAGCDRVGYAVADAAEVDAFARTAGEGEPPDAAPVTYAGPDVSERLRRGADDPGTFYVGLTDREWGARHVAVTRDELAEGLVVLGDHERASALLSNLAWQAVVGGAGGAVFARDGGATTRFARALPGGRYDDLRAVGGADARSVNLLDPGVPPSSAAFFDAVDAVTDALTSLLVVLSPQLRDAVREFVMAAHGTDAPASLGQLRELVRYATVGEAADVPSWVPAESPDLLERVAGVDEEAVGAFLDSLSPFLREPVRSLLADPDPDVSLVAAVRERAPLVVHLDPDDYGVDVWAAVGRALVHGLWGAAREFVPAGAEHPFYLVGDGFDPVLDAATHLDRLFARLHRDRVVAAFGVRSPAAVAPEPWGHLADAVGAHATFGPGDGTDDPNRVGALTGLDADRLASLPDGEFWFTGRTDATARRLLGYPPYPPERPAGAPAWLP